MKILHIYKAYYPESIGGIEKFIYSLSTALHSAGIENSIVTTTKSKQQRQEKVGACAVHYFPSNLEIASCPMSISMLRNFRQLANKFDLLHYHFPWPFADMLHLTAGLDKPTVITYHSDIVKQRWLKHAYTPFMQRFLQSVDTIVATSNNYLQSSPILKEHKDKTIVIPMGLDHSLYPNPEDETITKWKQQLGENFFLFVGVLRYYKGLEFLLEAVNDSSLPLVIIGSGPEEVKLKKIVAEKNIKNVRFVGQVSEVDKIAMYKLCRAVIAPAHLRSEAFCLSLLEGLLFNKPLISTDIGTGTSFVNKHGKSGLVVKAKEPLAMRQAMLALQNDEGLYQKLQQGAEQHYQEHFTTKMMRDNYITLYKEICR